MVMIDDQQPNENHDSQELTTPQSQSPAEVASGASIVATTPRNRILFLVLFIVAIIFGIWFVFSGGEDEPETVKEESVSAEIEPSLPTAPQVDALVPTLPSLPEPPPLVAPDLPTPPPPPAQKEESVIPKLFEDSSITSESKQARRKSSIMLASGGGLSIPGTEGSSEEGKPKVPSIIGFTAEESDDFKLELTSAKRAKATKIGNLGALIAQGKVIDAVLESAINTDLPGLIRAIVSRDVYAESGNNVLIPKGSRLIGQYQSTISSGQNRVDISWSRVIRPDGIDIEIDSLGVDSLGRAGIKGDVDKKLLELFSNSLLISTITTGFAFAAEQATDSQGITNTERSSGSSDRSGKVSDFALENAITDLGTVAKDAFDNEDVEPTITIDQGTLLKVFVQQDLVFPSSIAHNIRVVK